MNEQRRVAIVTGAGSGIGRAAAIMLGERGFRVVLVGRRAAPLGAVAEEIRSGQGAETLVLDADMGAPDAARGVVTQTVGAFGRIDVIVNNAAMAPSAPLTALTWAQREELFRVNAIGPAELIARAWPTLEAQHRSDGTIARIVNISSMATIDPFPGLTDYAASKAAINLLTKGCANEGAPHGIMAFAVAPGAVETSMLRAIVSEEHLPASATLRPEQVASVIVACALGERDDENGSVIVVPSA